MPRNEDDGVFDTLSNTIGTVADSASRIANVYDRYFDDEADDRTTSGVSSTVENLPGDAALRSFTGEVSPERFQAVVQPAIEKYEEVTLPSIAASYANAGQLGSGREAIARGVAARGLDDSLLKTASRLHEIERQRQLNAAGVRSRNASQLLRDDDIRRLVQRANPSLAQQISGGARTATQVIDGVRSLIQAGRSVADVARTVSNWNNPDDVGGGTGAPVFDTPEEALAGSNLDGIYGDAFSNYGDDPLFQDFDAGGNVINDFDFGGSNQGYFEDTTYVDPGYSAYEPFPSYTPRYTTPSYEYSGGDFTDGDFWE